MSERPTPARPRAAGGGGGRGECSGSSSLGAAGGRAAGTPPVVLASTGRGAQPIMAAGCWLVRAKQIMSY